MKKLISIKTIRETDTSPDLSYLGEYKSKPSATTIDREERGDCWRHEYRYWEPCNNHAALGEWEHVSDNAVNDSFLRLPLELRQTLTESTRLAKIAIIGAYYTEQDYLRHEAYNKGEWCCVGVEAVAEYTLNDTIQKMRSGGLYGIESDSREGYFQEVEAEQLEKLKGELVAIGFTVEEIDAYLTSKGKE